MKKIFTAVLTGCLLFSFGSLGFAEEAPQKIKELAHGKLAAYGKDPVIVDAVKAENAKGKTLDQVMNSKCGNYLRSIQNSAPYYSEIFVMDNLGANVAMTDKTSDYWQGDEAKFQKSFNGGSGAVFVDAVKFDDSAQAYLVQVSVPVWDGSQVIGAITFGIDVDKVD